jgi:hypothetical protein
LEDPWLHALAGLQAGDSVRAVAKRLKPGHYKKLPGCATDGKTYKEALANVEIIIQEWIETGKTTRPPHAPRGRLAFA